MTTTAAQVRKIRAGLGLTQAAFAAEVGVTVTSVSRWENGCTISPLAVRAIRALAARKPAR